MGRGTCLRATADWGRWAFIFRVIPLAENRWFTGDALGGFTIAPASMDRYY